VLGGRHPGRHDASRSRGLTDPPGEVLANLPAPVARAKHDGNRSTRLAKAPCVKRELRVIAIAPLPVDKLGHNAAMALAIHGADRQVEVAHGRAQSQTQAFKFAWPVLIMKQKRQR
jgi:hypothetical protein